jgi:hypothetical protein
MDKLVHENSVSTMRTLLREAGLEETKIEPDGVKLPRIKESHYLESVVLFVGASFYTQNPTAVTVALSVVANYFTDFFKGIGAFDPSKRKCDFTLVVEKTPDKDYLNMHYTGPPDASTWSPLLYLFSILLK